MVLDPNKMTNYKNLIAAMHKKHLLVIGDVMLDKYVFGIANRVSPEAPVPVLLADRGKSVLGGAGNVLANLVGLGAKSTIIGIIGSDDEGVELSLSIKQLGVKQTDLLIDQDRKTSVKTRFISSGHQLLRVDCEDTEPVNQEIRQELFGAVEQKLLETDLLVLSDYNKGLLDQENIRELISLANKRNIKVIVDPKKRDFTYYKGAHIITPNLKELSEASGNELLSSDEDVEQACKELIKKTSAEHIIATRSKDGLSIVSKGGPAIHIKTCAREVFDVSGAGDTVVATIAAAIAAGADIKQAAELANIAAGVVVSRVGTSAITSSDLISALNNISNDFAGDLSQPTPKESAFDQVMQWKESGLKVGFTNGCFDILHAGHVEYLSQARGWCDRLVVGLNADSSVKRLKGDARPYNNETSRAAVLSALKYVDLVVLFGTDSEEEDTPCKIVDYLRPDIFFKGGDYVVEDLPEAQIIQSYGGQVKIMGHLEGHSTTQTLKKMSEDEQAA
jgi:D-beta-D-heptose 7-phosphate kinase/D-beta-D-heptose 1-phosphate adenosyltransferase